MKELSREKLVELLNKHGGYQGVANALGGTRQAWHQKALANKRKIQTRFETVEYVYQYVTKEKTKKKQKRIFF